MALCLHRSSSSASYRRGHSLDIATCRVRNQEGSGLTIRIPRPQSERGESPTAPSPPPIPRYAQLTTSRYAHMAPNPHVVPVPKSKSLSASMDKVSLGHRDHHTISSSRGSTPSSGRSSVGANSSSSRPPSRKSPAHKPLQSIEGVIEKTDSPCGSEISLNSGVSSNTSVKSLHSAKSSSSASGRSSSEIPRTTQPRSSNAQQTTPTRKTPVRRSSTNSSIRSTRSSTPPDAAKRQSPKRQSPLPKASTLYRGSPQPAEVVRGQPTATSGGKTSTSCSKASPVLAATHRKNAVSSRLSGMTTASPVTPPPSHTDSLKRRTTSMSSSTVSSSSTLATGPRKMSSVASDGAFPGMPQDTTKKGLPIFNSYMSLFQVQEKLKKGEVIEGVLRINPKNYEDAYISAPVILGRGDGHLYWRGT